jgi:hypothetical protein
MTASPPPADPPRRADPHVRRTLALLAAIAIAPVAASYAVYYFWPRDTSLNYGELLARPAPPIAGTGRDGRPMSLADLRGKWLVVIAARGGCDAACTQRLYATRQARTMQGRDQDRVVRVLLLAGDPVPDAALAEHPGLEVARVAPAALAALPAGDARIYLIDPLGNLVLAWPAEPDIKSLARDLGRLLRASRIG